MVDWLLQDQLTAVCAGFPPKMPKRLHDAVSECAHHVLESWWKRAQRADDPIVEFKAIFSSEAERLAVALAVHGELMIHISIGTYAEWEQHLS